MEAVGDHLRGSFDVTTTLRAIAEGLNAKGITTPRGGSWSAVQVSRVLERVNG